MEQVRTGQVHKEQICTAERVCDAALKSLAGKDRGIDWFRENGVLTRERWGSRVAWYYWINFPLWMAFPLLPARDLQR